MQTKKPTGSTIPRKNTSVWVREDLWEDLKVYATRQKITVSDAVEQAISRYLKLAKVA